MFSISEEKTITLQQLIDVGVSGSGILNFEILFGDKVSITEEFCLSVAEDFAQDWAELASRLLSPVAAEEYRIETMIALSVFNVKREEIRRAAKIVDPNNWTAVPAYMTGNATERLNYYRTCASAFAVRYIDA